MHNITQHTHTSTLDGVRCECDSIEIDGNITKMIAFWLLFVRNKYVRLSKNSITCIFRCVLFVQRIFVLLRFSTVYWAFSRLHPRNVSVWSSLGHNDETPILNKCQIALWLGGWKIQFNQPFAFIRSISHKWCLLNNISKLLFWMCHFLIAWIVVVLSTKIVITLPNCIHLKNRRIDCT